MDVTQVNIELTMLISTVVARLSGLKDKLRNSKPLDEKEKIILNKIMEILKLHKKQLILYNQNNQPK